MATYRDTGLTVRCNRIMIDNPDKTESPNAQAGIQFDRTVVVDQPGFGRTSKSVSSCLMKYIPEPGKDGYNGNTTFALVEGIIDGITELTYDQYYAISACMFDHASAIQDTRDVAREAYMNASALQGNPNTLI